MTTIGTIDFENPYPIVVAEKHVYDSEWQTLSWVTFANEATRNRSNNQKPPELDSTTKQVKVLVVGASSKHVF